MRQFVAVRISNLLSGFDHTADASPDVDTVESRIKISYCFPGFFRRATLLLAPLLLLLADGCIIADPPTYETPPGFFYGGECMCATCWDRPFCFNRDTGEHADVNGDGTCPTNAPTLAEQTSRIGTSLSARDSAPLFCIPDADAADQGKLLQPAGNATSCPSDAEEKDQLGYIDQCKDLPLDCRPATCPEHGNSNLCNFSSPQNIGAFRTVCAVDDPTGGHKLREESCTMYGFDIPTAEPGRYCYLNCWHSIFAGTTLAPTNTCDPALFDPPGGTSDTLFIDLDPATSRAFITVVGPGGQDQGELHVSGVVGLRFSKNCLPPITLGDVACDDAALTYMALYSTDTTSISGAAVSNMVVLNPQPLPLTGQTTAFGSFLMYELIGGTTLYASADVAGAGRIAVPYSTVGAVGGSITWSTRTVSVNANLSHNEGGVFNQLILILGGTIRSFNDAPVAKCKDATLPAGAGCLASASRADVDDGSFDPDGGTPSCVLDATGPFGLGPHAVKLTCTDPVGATSSCDATVTVEDDTPPAITCPVSVNTLCTNASGATTTFTVTATDNCGGSPAVTCTRTSGSTFPLGTTVDICSVTDGAGHTASCQFNVTVALGDNPVCCPAGTTIIQGTTNNNTINGTSGNDCILGKGGQDIINGNGGNDIISGGDGDDIISGGSGNDTIFAGSGQDKAYGDTGNDVMSGGDGDDQVYGGDGADTLLGGQGQDKLFGENDADVLLGETGYDQLDGGPGADTLIGGGPSDICVGGPDLDTFLTCTTQTQ